MRYRIENMVASTDVGRELDLTRLAIALKDVEYEPENFPGLIYRLEDPKITILLFRTGKVVITGAKSLEQVNAAADAVASIIREAGFPISKVPKGEVQNIVASADLGQEINLNVTLMALGLERVEYEPEVFPGLVYRMEEPKVVILLFSSGKLVCTGARNSQDVGTAVDRMTKELIQLNLLGPIVAGQ